MLCEMESPMCFKTIPPFQPIGIHIEYGLETYGAFPLRFLREPLLALFNLNKPFMTYRNI